MARRGDFVRRRAVALRPAWRHFWWMVVRSRGYEQTLSRRAYAGIALRMAWCGLVTGGEHWWGPLHYRYEGARRRQRDCRCCGASMTPASEFEPLTDEELEQARQFVCKPTDEDVERALDQLKRGGLLRDGKFLWDR